MGKKDPASLEDALKVIRVLRKRATHWEKRTQEARTEAAELEEGVRAARRELAEINAGLAELQRLHDGAIEQIGLVVTEREKVFKENIELSFQLQKAQRLDADRVRWCDIAMTQIIRALKYLDPSPYLTDEERSILAKHALQQVKK